MIVAIIDLSVTCSRGNWFRHIWGHNCPRKKKFRSQFGKTAFPSQPCGRLKPYGSKVLYLCYILTGKGKVVGKVSNTWALNVQNLPPLTPPLHLNFVDSAKLCPWQIFLGNFGPRAWVHFSKWHSQGYSSYRRPSNPLNFKADDTLEIYIGFGTYFSQIGKIWISCRDYKCDLGCLGNYVVSNCSVVAAGRSMGQGGIWWIFQQLVDTWGQFDQLLYSSLNNHC